MEANHKQTERACIIKQELIHCSELNSTDTFNGRFKKRGPFLFHLSLNVSMSAINYSDRAYFY